MTAKFKTEKIFYMLLSCAVLLRLCNDVFSLNRWGIHSGMIYPYRHLGEGALYSTHVLLLEWGLALTGALLLVSEKVRWGAGLILVSYAMSLTQMFQNQKLLIWIVMLALTIQPVAPGRASVFFLKWQLALVYLFSGLHKIFGAFAGGETLNFLAADLLGFKLQFSEELAWVVIAGELLLPLILMKKPRLGIGLVILLHGAMWIFMPDLGAFSLTMVALSLLFVPIWERRSKRV